MPVAFPGAEGYGRFAQGGRGGDVYIVKNLKDDGKGSLRYGIENQEGPRTIVFVVSGTIALQSPLEVTGSFLTIAGQTVPGDGICLKDQGLKFTEVNDIIMRYIRIRMGDQNKSDSSGADCITSSKISDVILIIFVCDGELMRFMITGEEATSLCNGPFMERPCTTRSIMKGSLIQSSGL